MSLSCTWDIIAEEQWLGYDGERTQMSLLQYTSYIHTRSVRYQAKDKLCKNAGLDLHQNLSARP